jgi:hypothetical protein
MSSRKRAGHDRRVGQRRHYQAALARADARSARRASQAQGGLARLGVVDRPSRFRRERRPRLPRGPAVERRVERRWSGLGSMDLGQQVCAARADEGQRTLGGGD